MRVSAPTGFGAASILAVSLILAVDLTVAGSVFAQVAPEGAPKPKAPAAAPAPAKAAPRVAAPSGPATPVDGEWTVGDGSARMRLRACGKETSICGFTAWTRDPPGTDHRNPDPTKRQNSIIGTQILIDMKPAKPNRWEGQIYNPKDGKIYQASITLRSEEELRVEGCLIGFLCGGDTWKRFAAAESAAPAPAPARAAAPRGAGAPPRAQKDRPRPEPDENETGDPE